MNISNKNFEYFKIKFRFSQNFCKLENFEYIEILYFENIKTCKSFNNIEIFIQNIHKYLIFRNFRKKIFFFDFFILLFPNKQNIFQTIFSFFSKFIIGVAVPGYSVRSMESQIWVSRISRQFVTAARNLTLLRWRRATISCRPSARCTDILEPSWWSSRLYSVQ